MSNPFAYILLAYSHRAEAGAGAGHVPSCCPYWQTEDQLETIECRCLSVLARTAAAAAAVYLHQVAPRGNSP